MINKYVNKILEVLKYFVNNIKKTHMAKQKKNTVKPTYNGTAWDRIFSVAGRFRLIQIFEAWILAVKIFR